MSGIPRRRSPDRKRMELPDLHQSGVSYQSVAQVDRTVSARPLSCMMWRMSSSGKS